MAIENEEILGNEESNELTNTKISSYFRPPAGVFNKESLNTIKELGYYTIFWSVAYKDWETNKNGNIDESVASVVDNLHNGAIILLHTVSNENVKALPIIIDKIREEGYAVTAIEVNGSKNEKYMLYIQIRDQSFEHLKNIIRKLDKNIEKGRFFSRNMIFRSFLCTT